MTTTKRPHFFFKSALIALAAAGMSAAGAMDVTIEVSNVESAEGNLNVAIYDNAADLEKRSTYRAKRQPAAQGKMEIVFKDMPAGEYGVMLYQDINGNNELDTNLLGIPTEPWSASLLGRSVFGAPGWEDINFKLPEAGDRIKIDMN
ncbi:MAG: DUF2141 domain-containing protein [Burkholderiaceae bacterium]